MKHLSLSVILATFILSTASVRANEPTIVRYWFAMNDRQTAQLLALVPQFEAAHPGLRIEATPLAYADLRMKLLRSVVDGSFPDVARIDSLWLAEFASIEALDPLDAMMPDFASFATTFFPGPLQTNVWRGHIWGLPQDTNTQVLFYDRAAFDAAGLSAPQTVDELAADACALTDSAGWFGLALAGTSFWPVAPLFYALGGQIADPTGVNASGYLDGEASQRAFQTLVDLYGKGCLVPNLLDGSMDIAEGYASGKYRMIFEGPALVDEFRRKSPQLAVDLALVPAGPDGTKSVVGGSDVVVFSDSTRQDAALAWVRFLVGADAQRALAQAGALPTLRALVDDPLLPDALGLFMRQLETAQARPATVHWTEIDAALDAAFRSMLLRQQSVADALSTAAGEIDVLLKED